MKQTIQKLFSIYGGEERRAGLFALLGFLWSFAISSGLKFADALFLIHVGPDSLPLAYTLAACGNIILASILLYVSNHVHMHRIFLSVISIAIMFYGLVWLYLTTSGGTSVPMLWFSLKIAGTLFFTLSITCYWIFIDHYHHMQDAKRLYALFTSMIFLGVTATGLMMNSGWIDFRHMTLIIMSLLAFAAICIIFIKKSFTEVHDESDLEVSSIQADMTLGKMVKGVFASKFTMLLMLGNFITYLLLVITEFNYLSAFDHYFDPQTTLSTGGEEDSALTQFLGKWIAVVSIANLVFGLFFYSRIIRRWGIGSLLVVTPLILLVTFGGWTFSNAIIFPIIGLFVVEGTLYVIDDSNFNLLLNAVPSKLKYKIRIAIESFFEPIGMLTSSLLLSAAWINSKILGFILAAILMVVVIGLIRNYLKAIYYNLSLNAIHFQRTVRDWFLSFNSKEKKNEERRLLTILAQNKEQSQAFALQGLLGFSDESILMKLLKQTDALPDEGKIRFIELLSESSFALDKKVIEHLQYWSKNEGSTKLKSTIVFYLAARGLIEPENVKQHLHSHDLRLRAASILSLEKPWEHLSPAEIKQNQALAVQNLRELLGSNNEEEICMGLVVLGAEANPHDVEILLPFLENPSIQIAREAANAFAKIADPSCIPHARKLITLLNKSSDNEFRLSCLKVLGKMADTSLVKGIIGSSIHFRPNERRVVASIISKLGSATVPILLEITKDSQMHDRCRILAGRILGSLDIQRLRENLYDIISIEIERAYFYFYHSQTVQKQNPHIDLKLLEDALFTEFQSVLDFIIQLLATAGEIEDCELLSRSLRSINPRTRSQVIETLEKTCETKIFRLLDPIVSDEPIAEKLSAYRKSGRSILSLEELLNKMSFSSSRADRIVAIALMYKLQLAGWQEMIRNQMPGNEEIFQKLGQELQEA